MHFILGPEIYNNLKSINWNDIEPIMLTVAAVNSGAILAFVMEITEFLVVTYTSSLTLSVTGIFKVNYKYRIKTFIAYLFCSIFFCFLFFVFFSND